MKPRSSGHLDRGRQPCIATACAQSVLAMGQLNGGSGATPRPRGLATEEFDAPYAGIPGVLVLL